MPPRRACDICYKRKIQCLIKTPGDPCDWCSSQDLTCTFDRVIQKDPNKRTATDLVHALTQRVEELEEALQSPRFTGTPAGASPWSAASCPEASGHVPRFIASPSTAPGPRSTSSPSTHAHHTLAQPDRPEPIYTLSRCQLGNNWYFKGIGIFSSRGRQWVARGAGQRLFLENFDIFANPTGPAPRLVPTIPPERTRILPPEATCRYLFGGFLGSKTSIIFPILERRLFEDTIARAYDAEASDLERQASAKACIWAMIALAASTAEAQQVDSIIEPKECVDEVRQLLTINNGTADLDSLQANLLLWAYQKMRGQCREASITLATASRMVCDLGGHFLLSRLVIVPQHIPMFDEQTRLHIRRLFWLCYCFDKDVSLATNSPPLLTSEHCDVSGPGESSHQTSWYNKPRDTDLAKIKENASRSLCSPRAFRYTEGELLAHVRELDDQLEEWRLSIEPRHRPRLSIPSDSSLSMPSSMSVEDRTHMIHLQLDYLFTMINIHTIVRKCGDLERNLPDDLHSVVHSSADLSIEASRSIFRFLDTVVDFWKEDSVWVVSHYAPMAAMPLFVNILIHPVGQPADSDLLILSSIGDITRKIPTERLSKEAIEQIQGIGEFVMELVRLGHSAAWKVKKGEREYDLDIIHT